MHFNTRSHRLRVTGSILAAAGVAAGAIAMSAPAYASAKAGAARTSGPSFNFSTHDNSKGAAFNQLLGINDSGVIVGYYGSGSPASTSPNRGYRLYKPYHQSNFKAENFPGAQQTQVIAINDSGTTGGFYADPAGDNFGFIMRNGIWTVVIDPHTTGTTNQILGLNNNGMAVGFYTDSKGNAHGFEFNFHSDTFSAVNVPGASSVTATGINASGEISGFCTKGAKTEAFLITGHKLAFFSGPKSTNTSAFGVNNAGEVVGSYAIGSKSYGFVWSHGKFATVNDPSGQGSTVINGVNSNGEIVGFYGTTVVHGFLGTPKVASRG